MLSYDLLTFGLSTSSQCARHFSDWRVRTKQATCFQSVIPSAFVYNFTASRSRSFSSSFHCPFVSTFKHRLHRCWHWLAFRPGITIDHSYPLQVHAAMVFQLQSPSCLTTSVSFMSSSLVHFCAFFLESPLLRLGVFIVETGIKNGSDWDFQADPLIELETQSDLPSLNK